MKIVYKNLVMSSLVMISRVGAGSVVGILEASGFIVIFHVVP